MLSLYNVCIRQREAEVEAKKYLHCKLLLTCLSAVAGIAGICLSLLINSVYGLICAIISCACNLSYVAVFRKRKTLTAYEMRLGSRMNMFAGVIAYGLAPIAVGYGAGMHEWYFIIVLAVYAVCSVIRLAHLQVSEELLIEADEESEPHCDGVPPAAIAPVLTVFYLIATMFKGFVCGIILSACYVLFAFLFLLRFRFPKFGKRGLFITLFVFLASVVLLITLRYTVFDLPVF